MTSSRPFGQLHLFAPGDDPSPFLRARLREAQEAGDGVLHIVPSRPMARRRALALAAVAPVLDPPITTILDLARILTRDRKGAEAAPPAPRLLDFLFQDALSRIDPDLEPGPGLAASARRSVQRLLADGWTPDTFSAAAERIGHRWPAVRTLARLWTLVDRWCPEADVTAPLRMALESGRFAQDPPRVLLVELGAFAGTLEAQGLGRLVDAVRDNGGRVLVAATDLPTGDGGGATALRFARSLLPHAQEVRHGDPAGGFRPPVHQVVVLEGARETDAADLLAAEVEALLEAASNGDALLDSGIAVCCPSREDFRRAERALRNRGLPVAETHRRTFASHPGGRYLLRLTELLEWGGDAPVDVALELLASGAWPIPVPATDVLVREIRRGGAMVVSDIRRLGEIKKTQGGAVFREILERLLSLAHSMSRADPGRFGELFRSAASRTRLGLDQGDKGPPAGAGSDRDREPPEGVDPRRSLWEEHGAAAASAGHRLTPDVVAASGAARPVGMLDELILLLEERGRRSGWRPTLPQWLRALRALMRETDLQLGSSPHRGVRLRGVGSDEPAAVVFITGLVQGRLPRSSRHDPFLRDDALLALGGAESSLIRLRAHQPDEERENALLAMSAARSRLYLCTARMDDTGRELVPSFFLDDVARALGFDDPGALPRKERRLDDLAPEPAAAGTFPDWRARVRGEEEAAWLREKASRMSSSQLTRYAECAFKHLVESRLRPENLDPPLLDAAKQGSLIHDWLRSFGSEWGGWNDPDAALARLPAEPPSWPASRYGTARAQEAWRGARADLETFVRWEAERLSKTELVPRFHELAFGLGLGHSHDPASVPNPVSLPLGSGAVEFAGSIDRVDLLPSGSDDPVQALAVDYKTGDVSRFRKGLELGEEIQLPLYLKILERGFGLDPVGALYLSIRYRTMTGFVREEFAPGMGDLTRNVLVLDTSQWDALRTRADEEIERLYGSMTEPRVPAIPRRWDCGLCKLDSVCRIDLWRARFHV